MSLEGLATDTLNLPNVKTLRHVVSVGQHTYESASINPTGQCCMFARPNGTKRQVFADTPREGMPAVIHHKRRRWSCTVCGGSPYEDLPWAAEGRKMTERLGGWILDQATQRPFVAVANDCGLDPGTVTNVFEERAKPAVLAIKTKTPRVLGLDEKHIFGGFRAVMGDIEKRTMFWMLPARNADTLGAFFAKIPDRERVEVVTVDMFKGYRKILEDWFPTATVVIDKYHITQYASFAMDRARAGLRSGMNRGERVRMLRRRWTLLKRRQNWEANNYRTFAKIKVQYPQLAEIYEWKERACEIWDLTDRREAEQAYLKWLDELPGPYRTYFKRFTTAMKNWGPEIFNYFDHRFTNAYVERLNGMIADANRLGRGYSYRVLFFKTMLRHGVPKTRPKRLDKSPERLDGVVPRGLGGSIFGLDYLGRAVAALGRATWRRFRDRGYHGVPLSTLSEDFRDTSVW
ncbi:ISL3 family transposase [Sphingobium sp. H39-3-25]|uniref:ISL3 family transposase n=1 Tax=Sphingobium arseniciresistens TaxID=3030834 RepID=UPI0023B924A8|nr:ISL3 family transposase [Sphingobium arseniciresistens]